MHKNYFFAILVDEGWSTNKQLLIIWTGLPSKCFFLVTQSISLIPRNHSCNPHYSNRRSNQVTKKLMERMTCLRPWAWTPIHHLVMATWWMIRFVLFQLSRTNIDVKQRLCCNVDKIRAISQQVDTWGNYEICSCQSCNE